MTIMNGTRTKIRRTACTLSRTIASIAISLKLNDNDQQAYWGWRHEHSDALLKINIH